LTGSDYECSFTEFISGNAGGSHLDTVTATVSDDDGNDVDGVSNEVEVTFSDIPSVLVVSKTPSVDEVPETGGDVEFTVLVENDSLVDTVTVTGVVDDVFGDVSGSCSPLLPVDLDPGDDLECRFTRTLQGNAGDEHVNLVTASGIDDDGYPVAADDDATVTYTDVASVIEVTKDDGNIPIVPGLDFAYEFRVTNNGPATAWDSTILVDDLPAGLSLVTAAGPSWDCSASTNKRVECVHPGPLAAGESYPPVQVIVATDPDLTGSVRNIATVTNPDDPDGDDDTIVTPTTPTIDLELAKTARQETAALGDVLTFDIRLHNAGPSTATDILVTEQPGEGLEFVSASADTGSFSAATGTWSIDRLEVGESTVLHYEARLIGRSGTTNEAWVSDAGQIDEDSVPNPSASRDGEDDEAAAEVKVEAASAQPPADPHDPADAEAVDPDDEPGILAYTGMETARLVLFSLGLMAVGLALIRRRSSMRP
jgi:uncharacterized repeat protein (TIGR01451 family)